MNNKSDTRSGAELAAASGEPVKRQVKPYRIGVMLDFTGRPGITDMFPAALSLALEDAYEAGQIDRPVELVLREVDAHPVDTVIPAIDAFHDLVQNEKVLGIAGPMATDNCMGILPYVEQYKIPTLSICGTYRFVGDYAFAITNGGLADEPAIAAAWLKGEGHKRIAILKDQPSHIGEEYTQFFRQAAQENGLSIVMETGVSPIANPDQLAAAYAILKESKPDALVYWGIGGSLTLIQNEALRMIDWFPPRIMSTAFVGGTCTTERAIAIDGWHGIDQYHEGNQVFQKMIAHWKERRGAEPVRNSPTSCGYDIGRAIGLGLGRMTIASPTGLRDGLETIRRMPSCTGAPDTVITFGPQDHRGFKSPHFLVIRRAEGGTTHLVGTAPVA